MTCHTRRRRETTFTEKRKVKKRQEDEDLLLVGVDGSGRYSNVPLFHETVKLFSRKRAALTNVHSLFLLYIFLLIGNCSALRTNVTHIPNGFLFVAQFKYLSQGMFLFQMCFELLKTMERNEMLKTESNLMNANAEKGCLKKNYMI